MVKVVVRDRTEGAGEENVLSLPPSVFAAVPLVPAFENAASDAAVSPFVDTVGAADFIPLGGGPSCDGGTELLLAVEAVYPDLSDERGSEKDRWPLDGLCDNVSGLSDRSYGWLFDIEAFLLFEFAEVLIRF